MIRVLFVCLGNICRSPTAQAVLARRLADEGLAGAVTADSAATHPYNLGLPPDPRARAAARARGVDLGAKRARLVSPAELAGCDYILAMDRENRRHLRAICLPSQAHKVQLLMDLTPGEAGREVPDPYEGGETDFSRMVTLVEAGVEGLLAHIRARHGV